MPTRVSVTVTMPSSRLVARLRLPNLDLCWVNFSVHWLVLVALLVVNQMEILAGRGYSAVGFGYKICAGGTSLAAHDLLLEMSVMTRP